MKLKIEVENEIWDRKFKWKIGNTLFLGDIVGVSGCNAIKQHLRNIIRNENIDFTIVNGENAASDGVGITQNIFD